MDAKTNQVPEGRLNLLPADRLPRRRCEEGACDRRGNLEELEIFAANEIATPRSSGARDDASRIRPSTFPEGE